MEIWELRVIQTLICQRIDKLWYNCTIGYYTVIGMNNLKLHIIMWDKSRKFNIT